MNNTWTCVATNMESPCSSVPSFNREIRDICPNLLISHEEGLLSVFVFTRVASEGSFTDVILCSCLAEETTEKPDYQNLTTLKTGSGSGKDKWEFPRLQYTY